MSTIGGLNIVNDNLLIGYDASQKGRFYTGPSTYNLYNVVDGSVLSKVVTIDGNDDISFDGVNDYVQFSNANYPATWSDTWTSEVVMMVPIGASWSNAYYSNILAKGSYNGSFGLTKVSIDNYIRGYLRHDGATNTTPSWVVSRDIPLHAVVTWDGTDLKLYGNGELIGIKVITGPTGIPDQSNWVAAYRLAFGGNVGLWYEGYIYIARVYISALTEEEVNINYAAYKPRFGL